MKQTCTQCLTHYNHNAVWQRSLTAMLLLLIALNAFGQTRTVNGLVKDELGAVLPGVNILQKGTTHGTTTDSNGHYSIDVSANTTLVFSFIGFISEEVQVGTQTEINITMNSDVTSLDEIVVVGYGVQKKSDLTGAVSLADPAEMKKQAASDVSQMLQGRVAGVSITSDGQPGATPSVRIRGIGTINAGAEPLYVVDGFPLSGGIRDINPNDIESIQVLKDATAGAIYGNRGGKGVVIITTKRGKKNQDLSISVSSYYGFQKVPQRLPLLDRVGYQMINSELLTNAGRPLVPGNDPNSTFYITDVDTDWQDAGYKDGHIANHNIGFSGGTAKTNYFVSLDYLDNAGTLVGSGPDYKRYSMRTNSETQLGKFKVGENVFIMKSDENPLFYPSLAFGIAGNRPSMVNDLLQAAPTIPLYDPAREGGFGGADEVIHQSITLNVPGINTLVKNNTVVNRVLANIYGELEILKGLTFKTNLAYDNTAITDESFVPKYDLGYFFPNTNARFSVGSRNYSSFLIENTATYAKEIGKHNVTIMAGQTYQDFDSREFGASAAGLEKPYILSLSSGSSFSASEYQSPSAMESLLGRINYSFDDRYLVTFNIRRDGSSRFNNDHRYEVFPSVGLAWKIHNDFTLPAFVKELKLRGGVGEVGNQDIINFGYQSVINRSIPYEFASGRELGAATTRVVDPLLQWETRITRSLAIDALLFEGKLEFTAEYYANESKDLLIYLPIPSSAGSLDPRLLTNTGSLKNSGIELSAEYEETIGDFTFGIAPNFYTVHNEVTDIGLQKLISGAGARTVVGRSIGEHYGWIYEGIFQDASEINTVAPTDPSFDPAKHAFQSANTAAGDVKFKDLNNDAQITDDDRTFLGSGLPKFHYGLNLNANYKGFDFTLFLSGSGGNLINSNLYRGLMGTSSYNNWHEDILDRWTSENPNTAAPRVIWNDPNANGRDSNRQGWLQKGDYMRLNTISLGYSLPNSIISKLHLSSARIYATLQNLKTLTAYKGYNPDFQAGTLNPGWDFGTYPRPKTTMFGIQLKF